MNAVKQNTREQQEFYTLQEVAALLRMDVEHMRKSLIKRRRIAYHQSSPGSSILIRHADLLDYVARMRVSTQPERP